jgi:DNA-directed RNA polymerase subunit RPC12/RpoP
MITCKKCQGKVFVDLTFTDNRDYETFCLRCGTRTFVSPKHPQYKIIDEFARMY